MTDEHSYTLYSDDTGSETPGLYDEYPYFGLGGIIVRAVDEPEVLTLLRAFKTKWNMKLDAPLHGAEIRAVKGRFRWLKTLSEADLIMFKTDLLRMVLAMPIVVHACIVDRENYYKRYKKLYGKNIWAMRSSAAVILLERALKFVRHAGGKRLTMRFERCGTSEDHNLREVYRNFRTGGHPFNPDNASKYDPLAADSISSILDEHPIGGGKEVELLQVADLCLFPVATSRNGKPNAAFAKLLSEKRLVDALTADPSIAVKFYCFD